MITDPALASVAVSGPAQPQEQPPPLLRHLVLGSAIPSSGGVGPGPAAEPPLLPAALVALLALAAVMTTRLAALLAAAAALTVRLPAAARRRRAARWSLASAAVLGCIVAPAAAGRALTHSPPPPASTVAPSAFASRPPALPAGEGPSTDGLAAAAVWSQLVHIEKAVAGGRQALATEDARILVLTDRPHPTASVSGGSLRPAGAAAGPTPGAAALASLLTAHQQAVVHYQASLQEEYQFFVVAAQRPEVQAALAKATAAAPADSAAVVRYDLAVTAAQLRQEQAIAAARAAAAPLPVQPTRPARGVPRFTAPVGGVVTQGFGPTPLTLEPAVAYDGVAYGHFHTGIDIANVVDSPVGASAPGRVIFAGSDRDPAGQLVGYGNYVVIDHGQGYISLYAHLDQVQVTAGQTVVRGQEVGLLGSTGWSTGPHLHFEIRHGGELLNPEPLLGAAVKP